MARTFSEISGNASSTGKLAGDVNTDSSGMLFGDDFKEVVSPLCVQYRDRYIVSPSGEGLLIIDQYRAHVRILFEDYMRRVRNMSLASQGVMFPETITLDESQRAVLSTVEEDLKRMGFNLEYESGDNWSITSVPAILTNVNPADLIFRILDSVNEQSPNFGKESLKESAIIERIALVMARSGAIRRGQRLTTLEMEHILGDLFALPNPGLTPEGNPIFCRLDEDKIDKMLGI